MSIVATWKGTVPPAEYHHGIPARDLTEGDWELLDAEQRAVVTGSKLYALAPSAPVKQGGNG